jgi:hypothetical protein
MSTVETVFILLGGLLLLLAAWMVEETYRVRSTWMKVSGEVVGFSSADGEADLPRSTSSPRGVIFPVVRVSLTEGLRLLISPLGHPRPNVQVGETVDVYVNPRGFNQGTQLEHPDHVTRYVVFFSLAFIALGVARIKIRLSESILFGVLGLIFLLAFLEIILDRAPAPVVRLRRRLGVGFGRRLLTEAEYRALGTSIAPGENAAAIPRRPVLAIFVFLLGLGLLRFGERFLRERERFLERAVLGTGQVVRLSSSIGIPGYRSGQTCAPVVRYKHPAYPVPVEFVHWTASDPPGWSVGEEVRVYFDPTDHRRALLDTGPFWIRFPSLGMLIVGGLCIFMTGPYLWWLHKKESREKSRDEESIAA